MFGFVFRAHFFIAAPDGGTSHQVLWVIGESEIFTHLINGIKYFPPSSSHHTSVFPLASPAVASPLRMDLVTFTRLSASCSNTFYAAPFFLAPLQR